MQAGDGERPRGHYAALGVPASASPKAIERAFQRWRAGPRGGVAASPARLAAEAAYHVLADPASRLRHDRQLGLVPHPAWRAEGAPRAAALVRRGLRSLAAGRPGPARRLLGEAAALGAAPPEAGAWLGLAIVRSGGCPREGMRACAEAVARAPREAAARFALAEACAAAGRRRRAALERRRGWALIARETLRAAFSAPRV